VFGRSDERQNGVERRGDSFEVERLDQKGRVADLPAGSAAHEPPQLIGDRTVAPHRLLLHRPEGAQVAVRPEHVLHRVAGVRRVVHHRRLEAVPRVQPREVLRVDAREVDLLEQAREALGAFVGADANDLTFVQNATTGVNMAARALDLKPGDEVLTTDEEHPGVLAPLGAAKRRRGFDVRIVPFDEIAGEVVKELKVKLLGAAPKVRTTDPKAYALFLQARELGRQLNAEAFAKSDALYQQVLEIDPRYAPAWVELAWNFSNKVAMSLVSSQEGYAHAREAAEKALAIDPDYAPARASLGWIAMFGDNDLAVQL